VSERAWEQIAAVDYAGYDALHPWRQGVEKRYLPYTHNWHALAGLRIAIESVLHEGLTECFDRHKLVAQTCRDGLRKLGINLWAADEQVAAPTVTAARLPEGWSWSHFDGALRELGMAVGGSYGSLAGKVFRMGHMGHQARLETVETGLTVIEVVLGKSYG
jgi:aspartate aminotransferase-like enzyme